LAIKMGDKLANICLKRIRLLKLANDDVHRNVKLAVYSTPTTDEAAILYMCDLRAALRCG